MGILKLYHSVSVKTAMFFITAFVFVFQETRRQALKPPILVVPYKTSDLICFITRDEEEDDTDSSQVRKKIKNISFENVIFKKKLRSKRKQTKRVLTNIYCSPQSKNSISLELEILYVPVDKGEVEGHGQEG